ncbi:MAG TPA: 50S ribosomal protein L9 [Kiritimatiellia bacterium]|nr:50S ribosomal protein L9 [Kiritimatiellia bacterium]
MSKQVILVEDVPGLGEQGQIVRVADGYARNFLLPRKLGSPVTPATLRQLDKKKAEYEAHRQKLKSEAETLAAKIQDLTLTLKAKAGGEDRIFGSITTVQLLEALEKEGIKLKKHQVVLERPIRELGDYKVAIRLTSEIHTNLNVSVIKE